jgi:hypothetical protein
MPAAIRLAVRCTVCDDTGWVCENHPDRPWDGGGSTRSDVCGCGAGKPCPTCNMPAPGERPRMGPGMTSLPIRHAVAWFDRDDWEEIKSLCPPGDLQDTHDEWLASARAGLKGLGVTENEIEKVVLTPNDLRDWKAANGGKINSQVRAQLAIEFAMKRQQTRH